MIVGGRYRQLLATSPDHFPMLMTEELQNRGICFLTPQSLASSIYTQQLWVKAATPGEKKRALLLRWGH